MRKIYIFLSVLFLAFGSSSAKILEIPPYVRPFIEKGDKAIGPIKVLEKGEGYITCFIYPKRVVIDLSNAKIIGDKELHIGTRIFVIQKKSGRYIIIPVEENHEKSYDIYKDS